MKGKLQLKAESLKATVPSSPKYSTRKGKLEREGEAKHKNMNTHAKEDRTTRHELHESHESRVDLIQNAANKLKSNHYSKPLSTSKSKSRSRSKSKSKPKSKSPNRYSRSRSKEYFLFIGFSFSFISFLEKEHILRIA
jgi:hypothetical protein